MSLYRHSFIIMPRKQKIIKTQLCYKAINFITLILFLNNKSYYNIDY